MAKSTKGGAGRGIQDRPKATSETGGGTVADLNTLANPGDDYSKEEAGGSAKNWLQEITFAKKRAEAWHQVGSDVLGRYRDNRATETPQGKRNERRTNILWSNTETLMSHLCVDLGTPDVKRSFPQPGKKTKVARVAAEILEKVLKVEDHGQDVTHEFEVAIEDHLLPGRGQIWLDLDEAEDENGDMNWLEAKIVHVPWDGYLEGEGRNWREVPWVGRMLLFSKNDLEKSFKEYADEIPLNYTVDVGQSRQTEEVYKRAAVWELWCKETKQRIYIAEDFPTILQVDDDPYRLKGFFPCPSGLYAVKTSNDRTPVALYKQYEDQVMELDRLTTRSYRLLESLKYCGVYGFVGEDGMPDMSRLDDGEFIPFKNFPALQDKGGLENLFMVRDLEKIMIAIKGVQEQRQSLIQTIYEVTGISDIIRGQSNPNETFGAQRLKARFGSNRSSRRQRIVQRFVRDAYRLKAELIAEHYSREQLQEMTGISIPTKEDQDKARIALAQAKQAMQQAQAAQQAIVQRLAPPAQPGMPQAASGAPMGANAAPGAPAGANGTPNPAMQQAAMTAQKLAPMPQFDPDSIQEIQNILSAVCWEDIQKVLRSNVRRLFMVDIETDDTAFEDEQETKDSANEFAKTLFGLMQETLPAIQSNPALIPMAKETVLFVADSYKVGQAFEDVINDTFDKMAKMPPKPAGDPKQAAENAKVQAVQAETRARLQNDAMDQQQAREEHAMTMQERQQNMQQDQQIHAAEMQSRMEEMAAEREKLQLQLKEMTAKLAAAGLPSQPIAA